MNPRATHSPTVAVIDFRRQSMVLKWHAPGGTWTAYDEPPALVHGVALIRASQANICLFARDGRLQFQVGPDQFSLSEDSLRIKSSRDLASFGLRRRFSIESGSGSVLFMHSYWTGQGDDFFAWLASQADDPSWRAASGKHWSEGVKASVLRSSCSAGTQTSAVSPPRAL
jgi:hypothetical protein